MLTGHWEQVLQTLDYGFQPIVDSQSAVAYGYEALLRNVPAAGFSHINDLFDAAYADGVLVELETGLRQRAVEKFSRLPFARRVKLFLNVDNRIFENGNGRIDHTVDGLLAAGLLPHILCIELSERHGVDEPERLQRGLGSGQCERLRIAVDDFGQGFSGLKLLYDCQPDIIKIDRFFIHGVAADPRRRLFVTKIAELARSLGVLVVAEGVERDEDLKVCRDIGCDLIQGYLVARPTTDLTELRLSYEDVMEQAARRASRSSLAEQVSCALAPLRPVEDTAMIPEALALFAEGETAVPVIDAAGEPVGLIRERDIKPFLYAPYGRILPAGEVAQGSVLKMMSRCPVVDIAGPVDEILNSGVAAEDPDGIIVAQGGRYLGFLSARALAGILAERDVAIARDQNPLTGLPGNRAILDFLRDALADDDGAYVVVYLDFDHFKPFNDTYGFAQGDRVIQLFANLLQQHCGGAHAMVGHLGGDDFVVGFAGMTTAAVQGYILSLLAHFQLEAERFYHPADRKRGGLLAHDRDGAERTFPLLRASAVMLSLPPGRPALTEDAVMQALTLGKKAAKRSASGFAEITPDSAGDSIRLHEPEPV